MENSSSFLGLSPEAISSIIGSAMTIVSIFVAVTIGYYVYHYFFDNKYKK